MFLTNKQANEKISGLEARVAELEGEVASMDAIRQENADLSEQVVNLTAERDAATADLATANATIADQETTINAANAKLATFEDEVANKAQLQISALGFKGEIPETKQESSDRKEDISSMTGIQKAIAAHKASKK